MSGLKVKVDYLQNVNYALMHNRIPVCQSVEIENTEAHDLHDLVVSCRGEFLTPYSTPVLSQIKKGETLRITNFDLVPEASKMLEITERIMTSFVITVRSGEETLYENSYNLELMPFDHWLGTTILPQSLASFITPNHPAVNAIIVNAASILKELTGSSAFNAYQSDNTHDVRMQVAAIYAAIHQHGIIYRELPASYEEVGQRISMPDQVLTSKIGNCLELTLLFATILEAVGINSGIVLQKGHAYLGVWLVNDCCTYSINDDASYLEKQCSRGIDEMMVLECTMMVQENTSFDEAVKIAERNLANHSIFEMFIDVRRCRLERFLPLPTRIQENGVWMVEQDGVMHDSCELDIKEHDRYDLSNLRNSKHTPTKFDIWERKLLDFTLRNSLLNLNLRRKAIQFISFDVDKIEDHLQDGEEYVIEAKPEVEFRIDTSERLVRSKLVEPLRELISNDIERKMLHSYQTEAETRSVLTNIYRAARNAIEETGANSLFLTIGTLRWFETSCSETPRYAPLLLLPVDMVYKKGKYYIRTRDEEITLNITLMEFLRQNYDIRINGLDPLPTDKSGVNVPLIFAAIRDAIKQQKRWDVEEECLLGTFSFSKFLMWNDVHNNRELLCKNNIVSSLVESRLTWTPDVMTSNLKDIDQTVSPADLALPVAVDSSQMTAVIEGGKGHSFILYGPPGTGKSQTITNLIANALYQGKRVLFVAEKMAALSVVQKRLAKIGLDPFCLELHSNKVTKRHVLQQLETALKVTHIVTPAEHKAIAEKIYADRKTLIEYMDALHRIDASDGMSLYDYILRYESVNAVPLDEFRFDSKVDSVIAAEGIKAVEDTLGAKLDTVVKLVGQPSQHPLNGLHVDKSMLADITGSTKKMTDDSAYIEKCIKSREKLLQARQLCDSILKDNDKSILSTDAKALYDEWRSVKAKWFIPRFFAKRNFIGKLREYNKHISEQEVDGLFDNLLSYAEKHERIVRLQTILKKYKRYEFDDDEVPESAMMSSMTESLGKWVNHSSEMRDWLHWSEYQDELISKGMECVAMALESRTYASSQLREAYMKALYRYKVETRINASPILVTFEGMLFDDKVAEYKRMAEDFQILTQKELYARLAARIPRVTDGIDNSSEIGLLNRNISNGGRGLSMRDLFEQIKTLLPRLCPCMLMSPMSVAQYLDLKQEKFDLVVFDEASQMPTSEAVGAIARGNSLIVVGDPKQMPPTSFFSSTNVDEEEASIDDMESILEDCRTLEIPSLQLNWHYRSTHESLIAFSNNEYYDGSLITFPSIDDQHSKVTLVPIDGYYDKGGKRSNKAEAEAIVKEIARRVKDPELSKHSIGVITFSVVQQALIEDMFSDMLDKDRTLHEAAEAMYEPIFIKNLENVQGDERDVILFSIGYGPSKDGKVSMNFGPLNNAGGERRLNVAVSRARREMLIFSTLKAAQIDMRRTKARGVEGLKHFLEYAETHTLPTLSTANNVRNDVLIAQQIAEELRKKGYVVTLNVGRSQFKVDVAISEESCPDIYKLGILLDGEGYRDTATTRDREIVQPSVLCNLKWKVMRVWSVDWYNNRERVIERIIEKLNETPAEETEKPKTVTFDVSNEKVEETVTMAREYEELELSMTKAKRMSDRELMSNIIGKEQPISFMQLCRRVCALRNAGRVTPTIQRDLSVYLTRDFYAEDDRNGKVVWMTKEDSLNYTWYRPGSGRDVLDIPMVEIKNVLKEAITEQFALQSDNLRLIAAKKLGFTRRGANVEAAFNEAIVQLKNSGVIEEVDGKLRMKE